MFHSHQRRLNLEQGILSLWVNWTISVGFIIVPVILSTLVSSRILPLIPLIFLGILTILDRRNRQKPSPLCFRIPHVAQVILVISAIAMLIASIYNGNAQNHGFTNQPIGDHSRILPVLEIFPIILFVGLYSILPLSIPRSCRSCRNRLGETSDRGIIGMLYARESKVQIKFLFWSGLAISLVSWCYYLFFYITVNINRTDNYVFILIPSLWYIISLLYFGFRYYTLWVYYCQNDATSAIVERQGTTIRYLVICDDKILLHMPQVKNEIFFSDEIKIDVPLKVALSYKENVTSQEAHEYFINASDLQEAETRLLFQSCDPGMYNSIYHYAAFVKELDNAAKALKGQWFTLAETNDLIRQGMASTALASELSRIYTVTMAWKAYDKSGNRLYEIKHYKPTFRLRDMQSWNVDYNDANWLYVAQVNEDKPFFKLRRMWHKMTKGLGK